MGSRVFVFAVLLALPTLILRGQMVGPNAASAPQATAQRDSADIDMPVADAAQRKAARTFASKKKKILPPVVRTAVLTPLGRRERALQLLDRFTFGPRPGEVARVLAIGSDKWLEQQLDPDSIPNNALNRRLNDFPTLGMSAEDALKTFPDRSLVTAVADG